MLHLDQGNNYWETLAANQQRLRSHLTRNRALKDVTQKNKYSLARSRESEIRFFQFKARPLSRREWMELMTIDAMNHYWNALNAGNNRECNRVRESMDREGSFLAILDLLDDLFALSQLEELHPQLPTSSDELPDEFESKHHHPNRAENG